MIQLSTLGRFDLDAYVAGYLVVFATGLAALEFKLENGFEKAANFSLKNLINKGMNFDKEHRKFLSHPLVQSFKARELVKLRAKYNVKYALFYDNPVGVMADVLANLNTSLGSRAFQRLFFGGYLVTEYIVGAVDSLERARLIPSSWAESCKAVFTRNRTDL